MNPKYHLLPQAKKLLNMYTSMIYVFLLIDISLNFFQNPKLFSDDLKTHSRYKTTI